MIAEFHIAAGDLRALLTRDIPGSMDPSAWPVAAPAGMGAAAGRLCPGLTGAARGEPGAALISLGPGTLSDHSLCVAAWNLFTTAFRPVPQYETGELIYPVEVTGSAPAASHYSNSAQAGGLHTDGTLLPRPPAVAALLCLSPADTGGETVLVDARALGDALGADGPGSLRALRGEHPFAAAAGGGPLRRHRVLRDSGEFEVRYLRRYIENGYRRAGAGCPGPLRTALDRFDALSADEASQAPVLLTRGQLLIWDNRRFLHGRRPFREAAGKRRLRRIYGDFAGDGTGRP